MMRNTISLFFVLAIVFYPLQAREFHVAANAKGGDGSRSHPWRLEVALAHPHSVMPGDTIWVHGGVYHGAYASNLTGKAGRPIIVRAVPGERVTIDGGGTLEYAILAVRGSYAWFWGIEVMTSNPRRITQERGSYPSDLNLPECVTVEQGGLVRGCKFINLVLHDGGIGFSAWKPAEDIEVYGCVMYNNGWQAPDRPHGHNIYAQNEIGTKRFAENILCHAFSHNVQIYGSENASLDNFVFQGNIIFHGGERNFLIGGGRKAMNNQIVENFFFEREGESLFNLGHRPWGRGVGRATITGNYMVGGEISFNNVTESLFEGNVIYAPSLVGLTRAEYPKNDWNTSMPRGIRAFVRANYYERGRGNIVVYNGGGDPSVAVDVSSVLAPGEKFVLLDAENYTGPPVLEGAFDGHPLVIPMVARQAACPFGVAEPPRHTPPVFGAFVLLRR